MARPNRYFPSPKAEPAPIPEPKAPEAAAKTKAELPKSRRGKKAMAFYFDPAVSQQFRIIAAKRGITQHALMRDVLNGLFLEEGLPPIATTDPNE